MARSAAFPEEDHEGAVDTAEGRYRSFFEDSLSGIVVTSPEGIVRDCNPAFLRLIGVASRDQVIGLDVGRQWRPGRREQMLTQLRRSGRLENFELEGERPDGQPLHVLANFIGRFDESGDLVEIVAFLSDETQRRHLEEQLRHAQRLEAVGQLAGGIAHDFNNLLTAILGYGTLIGEKVGADDPIRRDLEEILRAAERAAELTRGLLAFSRRQVTRMRALDLNRVVGEMQGILQRLIGEDVALAAALAADLGTVVADRGQIQQVITNLVVNGRDAMPRGGRLIIETANVVLDKAYVRSHSVVPPGDYVLLAVSDTGEGMEEKVRGRIFEPFFTTKEFGTGSGLGLAVVYGIVKQSGGFIWVYSEPGHGTTFKVYLPRLRQPAEKALADPSALRPPSLNGDETILLVEDEAVVRRLTTELLEVRGYRVLAAADGAEALEVAAGHDGEIHLLLADLVMPELAGPDVAAALRHCRPGVKVLFMSGYSDEAAAGQTDHQPGTAFLSKPFSSAALLGQVRELLGRPGSAHPAR
jgi:two-component system, cell cycle sensor histidine kinase and response regulator CckA